MRRWEMRAWGQWNRVGILVNRYKNEKLRQHQIVAKAYYHRKQHALVVTLIMINVLV